MQQTYFTNSGDAIAGVTGGLTGELPPGAYTVGVRGSGNGSVTFSLTLLPIPE